jgi:hypothetical protein
MEKGLATELKISINPDAVMERHAISDECFAVVVDDFLLNPDEVVQHARMHHAGFEMPERSYPGRLLSLAEKSVRDLHGYWRSTLSRVFSFTRGDINDVWQLSLTTLQPEDFTWIQRLCHSDPRTEAGKENFAAVIYLFHNPDLGGTGFFRYRDRKFWESMAARQSDDPNAGLSIVETRYPMFREAPKYMTESNEVAELLTTVPAKFNRMICYSGDIPHNACISDASLLTDDCSTGRLTLNCLASVWPKRR